MYSQYRTFARLQNYRVAYKLSRLRISSDGAFQLAVPWSAEILFELRYEAKKKEYSLSLEAPGKMFLKNVSRKPLNICKDS